MPAKGTRARDARELRVCVGSPCSPMCCLGCPSGVPRVCRPGVPRMSLGCPSGLLQGNTYAQPEYNQKDRIRAWENNPIENTYGSPMKPRVFPMKHLYKDG